MSVESDCQKDCEQTFAHDAKSRHKCVRGCHGELVGTGLWDKDNPCPCSLAENPVSTSWLWVGAAVALGAVAWLATRKKAEPSWRCAVGHKCVRRADDDAWHDTDLATKTTVTHKADPSNMKSLTLVKTAPDGTWAEYVLDKAAADAEAMHGAMQGLPDVYGSFT